MLSRSLSRITLIKRDSYSYSKFKKVPWTRTHTPYLTSFEKGQHLKCLINTYIYLGFFWLWIHRRIVICPMGDDKDDKAKGNYLSFYIRLQGSDDIFQSKRKLFAEYKMRVLDHPRIRIDEQRSELNFFIYIFIL